MSANSCSDDSRDLVRADFEAYLADLRSGWYCAQCGRRRTVARNGTCARCGSDAVGPAEGRL
jgi:hypothetical protein